MGDMLKVDNINVYYGQIHTLKDVSLDVKQSEIVALIGANGAGKSTFLKILSGQLEPSFKDRKYKLYGSGYFSNPGA